MGGFGEIAWRYRTQLWNRQGKGFKTKRDAGGAYHEYSMFYPQRQFAPLKIAFAFVATHNHFVLDHREAVPYLSALRYSQEGLRPVAGLMEGAA